MPFELFEAPAVEPSRAIVFSGNRLERLSEARADDCVERALADPAARLLVLKGGALLAEAGTGRARFSPGEANALGADLAGAILLGFEAGAPRLAAAAAPAAELPDGIVALEGRSLYAGSPLDAGSLGEFAQGAALLNWHATHRFCSFCGAPSAMRAGGYKRVCPACGREHFPRTDPVAIMLTVTRDACLLGRGHSFPPNRYSALAGFIEPGETIEDAVRRETWEESGIRLGRVVYHACQPWPFPMSLMVGCFGEALTREVDRTITELADCRWFGRDEVLTLLAGSHPGGLELPPPGAIAWHLIRAWAQHERGPQ